MPAWLSGTLGGWRVMLYVQPNAASTTVVGEYAGCLKLRVAAPPLEGRANEVVRAFIAARLGVARTAVVVERGQGARRKQLRIAVPCNAKTLTQALLGPLGD